MGNRNPRLLRKQDYSILLKQWGGAQRKKNGKLEGRIRKSCQILGREQSTVYSFFYFHFRMISILNSRKTIKNVPVDKADLPIDVIFSEILVVIIIKMNSFSPANWDILTNLNNNIQSLNDRKPGIIVAYVLINLYSKWFSVNSLG